MPLWRPDGKRVIFRTREGGLLDLYEKNLDGGADKTLLLTTDKDKEPTDVSPDGRTLAFGVSNQSIWMLPLSPPGPPFPYPPVRVQRGKRALFAGRPLGGVRILRGGAKRGLRHVLPEARGARAHLVRRGAGARGGARTAGSCSS